MNNWTDLCRIQKVMQKDRYGCGVACLAMASRKQYETVRQIFIEHKLGTRKNRQFATNFGELSHGLSILGVQSQIKRWKSWDDVDGIGIIAVNYGKNANKTRNWHWIVAEKHHEFGVVIHDPDLMIPSFRWKAPSDVTSYPFSEYIVRKSWIRIDDCHLNSSASGTDLIYS